MYDLAAKKCFFILFDLIIINKKNVLWYIIN